MFDRSEVLIFLNYAQKLIERPRRIEDQPHEKKDDFMWCEDWEIIELLKYFFNNADGYMGDPPPNRLKNNPLFDKNIIAKKAEDLLAEYKTATAIVEHFQLRRGV